MATFTHGSTADVWVQDNSGTERDISAAVTSVTHPISADTAEVTALGDTSKVYIAGLKDNTVSIEGSRDATIEGYLYGLVGHSTPRRIRVFPEGSSAGKVYYEGSILGTGYDPSSSVDDANKFSFEAQGTDDFTRTTV